MNRRKRRSRKHSGSMPTVDQVRAELSRERHRRRYGQVLCSTVQILVVAAAAAVLVAVMVMPVLRIY